MKEILERNLAKVRGRIAEACARVRRAPGEIRLVAVTKTVSPAVARTLFELGAADLGENRVQQAEEKTGSLPDLPIHWHMIGHLQRNKVKRAIDLFEMIHSVDSVRLAKEIDKCCAARGRKMPVLLQVNVSGEETKFGVSPQETLETVQRIREFPGVNLVGLMTMAPFVDDAETVRPVFQQLRALRDAIRDKLGDDRLAELSMGMTQDYEVAVEEGATIVRIGSALFAGLQA